MLIDVVLLIKELVVDEECRGSYRVEWGYKGEGGATRWGALRGKAVYWGHEATIRGVVVGEGRRESAISLKLVGKEQGVVKKLLWPLEYDQGSEGKRKTGKLHIKADNFPRAYLKTALTLLGSPSQVHIPPLALSSLKKSHIDNIDSPSAQPTDLDSLKQELVQLHQQTEYQTSVMRSKRSKVRNLTRKYESLLTDYESLRQDLRRQDSRMTALQRSLEQEDDIRQMRSEIQLLREKEEKDKACNTCTLL